MLITDFSFSVHDYVTSSFAFKLRQESLSVGRIPTATALLPTPVPPPAGGGRGCQVGLLHVWSFPLEEVVCVSASWDNGMGAARQTRLKALPFLVLRHGR